MRGILAAAPKEDPCFDVAGLPDPFSVYFPVRVTNLYTATIYVTALLISPPAGWTDSEQNIDTVTAGGNKRFEKSNATRAVMATPANETITVRWNYRTGSYAGPIIGFDDFTMTIYWENITTGTVDHTDDFETDFDGWTVTSLIGTISMSRTTARVVHGAYGLDIMCSATGDQGYLEHTTVMGAGSRAAIFGFMQLPYLDRVRVTVSSPVEDLEIVAQAAGVWRRFGVRLNPGASNTVRIYLRAYWATAGRIATIDYIRWVRW